MISFISLLDFGAFIGGISGALLIGNKKKEAFISFIIGSTCTGVLSYINMNPWLLLTSVLFVIIDIYYYWKWAKDESK